MTSLRNESKEPDSAAAAIMLSMATPSFSAMLTMGDERVPRETRLETKLDSLVWLAFARTLQAAQEKQQRETVPGRGKNVARVAFFRADRLSF
jgi:hypothetical protein